MPKTYDNLKVDFLSFRAETDFPLEHILVRKVKNPSPNFKRIA